MVHVIFSAEEMQDVVAKAHQKSEKTGFVPTMGALHEGHLSLVRQSLKENTITIISIFVNPTQFNDPKDLEKYPRTLDKDLALLQTAGEVYVFYPDVSVMYPDGQRLHSKADLGYLEECMEGKHRPGHFQGVVQVVRRLLDLVPAQYLYMGQKDFQQFTIIRHMLGEWGLATRLHVCPIVREPNGLAMSSRNERLSAEAREKAGIISQTLLWMQSIADTEPWDLVRQKAEEQLSDKGFPPEYLEIVDAWTLAPISEKEETDCAVVCIAVWVEGVRLIDNMVLRGTFALA